MLDTTSGPSLIMPPGEEGHCEKTINFYPVYPFTNIKPSTLTAVVAAMVMAVLFVLMALRDALMTPHYLINAGTKDAVFVKKQLNQKIP